LNGLTTSSAGLTGIYDIKKMAIKIRPATPEDLPFLERILFEAFFWDPGQYRPAYKNFKQDPEFGKLLEDWGRAGDQGVVAEAAKTPVGAAWFRYWTPERHSYGFVDADTPEIGIGVLPGHRGRGIGRRLLQALIAAARQENIPALCLSVAPENFALQLYQSEGFSKVGESGTSWTLHLPL
jgi:ribosomal protein S18 acetylase RimI-like enzyme